MDAILKRFGVLCALCLTTSLVQAATFKTTNFVVTAASDDIARRVANCAEYWRRDLAIQWLGKPLPNWYQPCPISVKAGQMGAGGQTTFTFENGEVFGWRMQVQGTLERILDSVIPHEVNHTIFASHFRRPLPRWADEGAATLFEHETEQARQTALLNRVLRTNRRIPLQNLLTIREYPADMQDVLTLYAEGYSLAGFLVGIKGDEGRHVYLKFLEDAHQIGWAQAIQRHYGFPSIASLEQKWTSWIVAGSPPLQPAGTALAQNDPATTEGPETTAAAETTAAEDDVVIRSQSPQEPLPAITAIDRAPAAIRSIPRQLRVARPSEEHQASAPVRTAELTTAANVIGPRSEDFRPRVLRHPTSGSSSPRSRLSPTAEGIATDPDSNHYAFPAARR